MLGDIALAVHPDDRATRNSSVRRRSSGSESPHPIIRRPILVDPEFGTGVVKVSPLTTK